MRALITAGATRNPIDAVRYLSANSSGRTGVAIAQALAAQGIEVTLLGSPEALLRAPELVGQEYGSTRDLMDKMARWVAQNPDGCVVHACAVGDYEVATSESKIPSGQAELTLTLSPTPKILDAVRGWGFTGFLVSFKAAGPETSAAQLVQIAEAQRARTQSDLVFANVLGHLQQDIALVGDRVQHFERRADALAALIERLLAQD